jgi:F0F1-type ATP synthase, subunit b
VIDARQNVIEGDLADAQKLKDESDAALKAYENELAAARARAHAISAETREKLNAASEAERKTLEERLTPSSSRPRKPSPDPRGGDAQRPRHCRRGGRRDRAAAHRRAARRQDDRARR